MVTVVRTGPGVVRPPSLRRRIESFPIQRLRSLGIVVVLLASSGVLHGLNMAAAPQRVADEGTYVARAWAVEHLGTLSPTTYGYDHPPLGWLQLSAWTWTTSAFERAPHAVAAGREAMLVVHLVSMALLWVLARRLELTRWAATVAVALFAVSPLAVQLHRQVYLDNLATPWVLAAFALACSPRRRLVDVAASGACFGIAVLTRETALLLLPALAWQFWRSTHPSTRRYAVAVGASLFVLVCGSYVLYAAVRHELLPSSGVSLVDGVRFQLFERSGSGSVLDSRSLGHRTVSRWLDLDTVGPVLALVAAPLALVAVPRLRPVAAAFLVLAAMVLWPGFLPVPLVIGMLPFGALLVAGVADAAWHRRVAHGIEGRRLAVPLVVAGVAVAALAVPAWLPTHQDLLESDLDAPMREATQWIVANVPTDRRLVVDDAQWVDLVQAGFPASAVVWFSVLDTDPEVWSRTPGGWRDYDVVVASDAIRNHPEPLPRVRAALRSSRPLAVFGTGRGRVEVRRVVPGPVAGGDSAGGDAAEGDGPAVGGTPADRATLGGDLVRNPSIELTPGPRRLLAQGEIDERVMTALAALAADRPLRVTRFPHDPAETATGAPRRVVELEVETADDARTAARMLRRQHAPYRPTDVAAEGARLTITYPVAALT